MQTPEEFALEVLPLPACCFEPMEEEVQELADLIRARDAEVRADERAKALAGFEWENVTRHRPVRVPCDCDNPTHAVLAGDDSPPTHASLEAVPLRRLVGPWQPVADEGGAS